MLYLSDLKKISFVLFMENTTKMFRIVIFQIFRNKFKLHVSQLSDLILQCQNNVIIFPLKTHNLHTTPNLYNKTSHHIHVAYSRPNGQTVGAAFFCGHSGVAGECFSLKKNRNIFFFFFSNIYFFPRATPGPLASLS